jgi:hypothetical protein
VRVATCGRARRPGARGRLHHRRGDPGGLGARAVAGAPSVEGRRPLFRRRRQVPGLRTSLRHGGPRTASGSMGRGGGSRLRVLVGRRERTPRPLASDLASGRGPTGDRVDRHAHDGAPVLRQRPGVPRGGVRLVPGHVRRRPRPGPRVRPPRAGRHPLASSVVGGGVYALAGGKVPARS